VIGVALETIGYFLFLWSVFERGRYATSWEMYEDHKLVTSGPYHYVRHPSYLAYFLLFFGLFFLLLNLVALIPLVAIPGYVRITKYEEQLLVERFGSEYVEYQERTGRFLPKTK
jgi:protein-S-isoprenylcysteine O-methyltransferase Ste14